MSRAVPAGEGLPQAPLHPPAQTEPVRQPPGHLTVRGQRPLDGPTTRGQHSRRRPRPGQRRAPGAGVSDQEPQQRQTGEVDVVTRCTQRHVVTEQDRDLVRVRGAPHPRQQRRVVGHLALRGVESQ